MPDVKLTIAHGQGAAERMQALIDGTISVDGCELGFYRLVSGEMLHRAFDDPEFNVAELSLSSYVTRVERGDCPYVALPIYSFRGFQHGDIYIRTDRGIATPQDLKGRRIGIHSYQLTSYVWTRGMLADEYGVRPEDLNWVVALHGRPEKHQQDRFRPPPGVAITECKEDKTVSDLLQAGEIDALFAPHPPACYIAGTPHVGRLFDDYRGVEDAYFRRTGIYPIVHIVGIRKELVNRNPGLSKKVFNAFLAAKDMALAGHRRAAAMPGAAQALTADVSRMTALMGMDYCQFGLGDAERKVLDLFLGYLFTQGLSKRRFHIEELFDSSMFLPAIP